MYGNLATQPVQPTPLADVDGVLFLQVAGNRTEAQIVESLRHYHKRPIFAKEALYSLFSHTHHTPQYNKEQLEVRTLLTFMSPWQLQCRDLI